MAEEDQVRPLAPATDRLSNNDDNAAQHLKIRIRNRRLKYCCVCTATFLLVLVIVILILSFTVFKVKDPKTTLNGITVTNLELSLNAIPQVKVNMSLNVDLSIKNPNAVTFEFNKGTTIIYYHGVALVEVRNPPGKAKARRTSGMNVTVEIMADRLMSVPELAADLIGGQLPLSSYTVISGRVRILNSIKIHVGVKMNCSMRVSISSKSVENMSCHHEAKL